MLQEQVGTVRDYAEAVFHRGRVPMEPIGFQPNWRDQPSKHKTYLGVPRLPLPAELPDLGPAGAALAGTAEDGRPWDLDAVSALLRLSYGVLDRRLRVGWNQDSETRIHYEHALWGRATASGGGMYPLETYWVAGGSGPLSPGVYHYTTAHHALERLLTGDVTDRVRDAVGSAGGADADQFLLVSVRFWKNSYKYNSFCYHVVTQDLGAMLGSWELIARGLGRPLRRTLWFADEPLNELLGLDTVEESVLAVVPLPWTGGRPAGQSVAPGRTAAGRLADRPFFERSTEILRFPQVEQVHLATLLAGDPARHRPVAAPGSAATPAPVAAGSPLPLPEPEPGTRELGGILRRRRSSFGAFVARPPLSQAELGTVLAGAASAQRYAADIKTADARLTRLFVLANRIAGLAPGTYAYEPADGVVPGGPDGSGAPEGSGEPGEPEESGGHRLWPIRERALGTFLQKAYFLSNYNLDQVGAVLAISANLDSALRLYGGRGYRVLSAEVGAVAQTAYVAAHAAGVGCGAVLGFDNIAIDEALGLDRSDERTFLFLLLGHERADPADVDLRLV